MIEIRVCALILAPPAEVWRTIERIETHTEWMRDAESITFQGPDRTGVGTAFACRTRVGPLRATDHLVVTRWEPGVAMGIAHCGAVSGDGEFTLTARGDGVTQFCWHERLRFPWWLGGRAGERAGAPVLRRIWQGNLAQLQQRIEAARDR